MKPFVIIAALFIALSPVAAADQVAQHTSTIAPLTYSHGATALTGWVARPTIAGGPASGAAVVVLPEWWGCTDYAQRRARELADMGYVALAADMYGNGLTTTDPAEAGKLAGPFYQDPGLLAARARAAVKTLMAQPGVAPDRIAVIGFCFGGSAALQLARAGDPIRAVVAFHPGLKTAAPATAAIPARILVLHGGSDQFVPPADVAMFMSEMVAVKAQWQLQIYGQALHAFSNRDAGVTIGKGLPIAYDAAAERAALAAMHQLFAETIAPAPAARH